MFASLAVGTPDAHETGLVPDSRTLHQIRERHDRR
jgi:hypothetical protein